MDRDHIINKIFSMRKDVEKSLKKKGYIVPKKTQTGSIVIGVFEIKKDQRGFYEIVDRSGFTVASGINLPQTAIILANKLSAGHWTDKGLLETDRKYGYYAFDEYLAKQRYANSMRSNNYDRASIMDEKIKIAKMKKDQCKNSIDIGFNKLLSLT